MKKTFIVLAILFALFFVGSCLSEKKVQIHFLDVGEGDAVLIQTPNNKTVLIDAGNLLSGYTITKFLKKKGIKRIDHVFLTHYDLDHIGGIFYLAQEFDIKHIYDNGQILTEWSKSSDVYRWYENLIRKRPTYSFLKERDSVVVDNISFDVFWPRKDFVSSGFNENSLVLKMNYGKFSCLFTGDLPIKQEQDLLNRHADIDSDVLKVGHHGNNDSSLPKFLRTVSPKVSVISVNNDNVRGYPSKQTLLELKKVRSKIYRTDKHGDIVVKATKKGKMKVYH